MAEGHDPSRWQASGQQPWSRNDHAFRPENPGPGGVPTDPIPQPERCFTLAEMARLGIELKAVVVAEVVYQLAGLIEQPSIAGQRLPRLSEQSVTLRASGAVSCGLADVQAQPIDDVQVLGDLVAMARRLIDGQVVGAGLARLLMSTPPDPGAIRESLAASSDRHLVANVVSQAVALTDGTNEAEGLAAPETRGEAASATEEPASEPRKGPAAGGALRSPRAHRSPSQMRVDADPIDGDSDHPRLVRNLHGIVTLRRLVMLTAALLVAAAGVGALAQGASNEVEAAAATPEGEIAPPAPAEPSQTESGTGQPATTPSVMSSAGSSPSLAASADATAQSDPARASSVGTSKSDLSGTDWNAIVADLDSSRSRAFETGDRTLLDRVNAADSPASVADRRMLSKLSVSGLRARGLMSVIERIDVQQQRTDQATLVVTDRRPAYRLVSASTGRTVSKVAARGEVRWHVQVRTSEPSASTASGRWRIYSVDAI
ncbi:MAG: hypothetical protein ACOYD0_05980 [Candidatus Nanopelagicales bacterium]